MRWFHIWFKLTCGRSMLWTSRSHLTQLCLWGRTEFLVYAYFYFVYEPASTFMFVYVCACLCARVHLQQAANSPLTKLFQLWSELCLCQSRVRSCPFPPLCSSLLHPLDYNPRETRAQALNTCFFMYWLCCQCSKYDPIYMKYSVNLHHLDAVVVLLSLLCCNYTVSNMTSHCYFLYNVCY